MHRLGRPAFGRGELHVADFGQRGSGQLRFAVELVQDEAHAVGGRARAVGSHVLLGFEIVFERLPGDFRRNRRDREVRPVRSPSPSLEPGHELLREPRRAAARHERARWRHRDRGARRPADRQVDLSRDRTVARDDR